MANTASLAVKRQVELELPDSAFVLYESQEPPEPEQDWLRDIRLYAEPFAADATSQQELGLRSASLRHYLKGRAGFFASKDRTARLVALLTPDDMERDSTAKIWAVLSRSGSADAYTLLLDLLCDVANGQRAGYSHCPGRAVLQIPGELLFRSGGCCFQGTRG